MIYDFVDGFEYVIVATSHYLRFRSLCIEETEKPAIINMADISNGNFVYNEIEE